MEHLDFKATGIKISSFLFWIEVEFKLKVSLLEINVLDNHNVVPELEGKVIYYKADLIYRQRIF